MVVYKQEAGIKSCHEFGVNSLAAVILLFVHKLKLLAVLHHRASNADKTLLDTGLLLKTKRSFGDLTTELDTGWLLKTKRPIRGLTTELEST